MNADFLVDFPGLGIHDIPVRRVAFEVFGFEVYWYGLLIASAIVLCLILASRHAPRYQMKSDDILDTFILIIPMSIVLARLSYVVFEWPYYAEDWRRIIEINQGGLMFYGGVAGGVLAVVIMCRIKKFRSRACSTFWLFTCRLARQSAAGAISSIRKLSAAIRVCHGV